MTEEIKSDSGQENAGSHPKVTHAILWAAALIGSALLLKGTEQADKVMWLLFVLAATSTLTGGSLACERRVWRKLIGKGE